MCQKPSRNSQTDLKISSIEDTQSGRLCGASFQKPPPSQSATVTLHEAKMRPYDVLVKTYVDDN